MYFHRHVLSLLGLFLLTALQLSISASEISVQVEGDAATQDRFGTLGFAGDELKTLGGKVAGDEKLNFSLGLDATLPAFEFSIRRAGGTVELRGKTPSEVLCAAYTALEEMGYRFEVTGPVAPTALAVEAVPETRQVVTPAIQRRGIRQHINFNTDVSSYPIAEAKEYIRNLARLRYNYMTFHSYPCHWTRDRYENRSTFVDFANWMKAYHPQPDDLVTGAYFYGGEFQIPDHPLVRPHIRFNKEYFCAPEFEDVIHTQPDRGQKAQAWLRDLMTEVKRCGMTLHFSTEPKLIDDRYNADLADRIVEDYPLIDLLEFNSQEGGDFHGDQAAPANEAMAEAIINGTDDAALNTQYPNGKEPEPLSVQTRNYANCIRIIRHLRADGWEAKHHVTLVCGSYATDPPSIHQEMDLAEKFLPADQILTVMPWYGSIGADAHVQESKIKPEILKRLIVNSWLELDGFMMMQQQAAWAIDDLARYITQQTGQAPYGIVCNQWRTTPNALSFRYLDEAGLDMNLTPDLFFHQTAAKLGIPGAQADGFAKAMASIDHMGDVRNMPGNLGFTLGWEIDPAQRTIGQVGWWGRKELEATRDGFTEAHGELQACRDACTDAHGQAVLDELLSGTSCSVEHLNGVLELKTIAEKYFDRTTKKIRDGLTADDAAFIAACATRADAHFQKYLELLGAHAADRGEEGMLVTYYWGPVVFCHNILAMYGKQGKFIAKNSEGDVVPLPLAVRDAPGK